MTYGTIQEAGFNTHDLATRRPMPFSRVKESVYVLLRVAEQIVVMAFFKPKLVCELLFSNAIVGIVAQWPCHVR